MPRFGRQDWGTPQEFLDAVEGRFGDIRGDLACTLENSVVRDKFIGWERRSLTQEEDSLQVGWAQGVRDGRFGYASGTLWCNPPFSDLEPWFAKANDEAPKLHADWVIAMLTPASMSTAWAGRQIFQLRSIEAYREVVFLYPRLTFVGAESPYPKDLSLTIFASNPVRLRAFSWWNWRDNNYSLFPISG